MAARGHFIQYVQDQDGDIVPQATVTVRVQGTETEITETIYQNDTGDDTTLTNPFTIGTDGKIEFYLDNPKRVDLLVEKTGHPDVTYTVDCMKVGLNWRGAYSAATTYFENDVVFSNGSSWVALRETLNDTPVEGDDWSQMNSSTSITAITTIQDEGVSLTQRQTLDFAGAGVTAADSGGTKTLVTIPGATAASDTPEDIATAGAVGTEAEYAREDHVHKHPAFTSGDLHTNYQLEAEKSQASGYASLGSDGLVPFDELPPMALDFVFERLEANQDITDNIAVDITGLTFPIAASEVWEIKVVMFYSATGSTDDTRILVTAPAGATIKAHTVAASDDNTTPGATGGGDAQFGAHNTRIGAGTASAVAVLHGLVINSSTAGDVDIQSSQFANGTETLTIQANSYLIARRVA